MAGRWRSDSASAARGKGGEKMDHEMLSCSSTEKVALACADAENFTGLGKVAVIVTGLWFNRIDATCLLSAMEIKLWPEKAGRLEGPVDVFFRFQSITTCHRVLKALRMRSRTQCGFFHHSPAGEASSPSAMRGSLSQSSNGLRSSHHVHHPSSHSAMGFRDASMVM